MVRCLFGVGAGGGRVAGGRVRATEGQEPENSELHAGVSGTQTEHNFDSDGRSRRRAGFVKFHAEDVACDSR